MTASRSPSLEQRSHQQVQAPKNERRPTHDVPDKVSANLSFVPPTAKPGVLDEFSRPDKWFDKIKIRRQAHLWSLFAHV